MPRSQKSADGKKCAETGSVDNVERADKSDGSSAAPVNSTASTVDCVNDATASASGGADTSRPLKNLADLRRAMELLGGQSAARSQLEARRKQYLFWDTQPVPKFDDCVDEVGVVEEDKRVEEIRAEPFSLPAGFSWDTIDVNDATQLQELYLLLTNNYVEDDDNLFRFDYSAEFLLWALCPPGWVQEWHCGVRVCKSGKLVGFISAIPAAISVHHRQQRMVEVNFLCVHKRLRSKRVAPVLIREVTRRVQRRGIFQAVYTAGVVLPKPVATCRYWHRSLNPRKLIDVKFSQLSRNMTMSRTLKLYRLPAVTASVGWRALCLADVPRATALVNQHLAQYKLAPQFTEAEFEHWFVPKPNIVSSFVVESDNVLTDFISYYSLPSTVMHHPTHKNIRAAYSFYCVATVTPIVQLMKDTLITAHQEGYDVFNALDLMQNKQFLEELKFGIGDGNLQYYLYNFKCPVVSAQEVGLVLQ